MPRLLSVLLLCAMAAPVSACASMAPLDDAVLLDIALASPDDLARLDEAKAVRSRDLFGGASFSDGKGTVLVSFSAAEYDAYLAYMSDRPVGPMMPPMPDWPVVRLSFQTQRLLFDPETSSMPVVSIKTCDADVSERGISQLEDVMWRGRFVISDRRASEVQTAIESDGGPQSYEVFFHYTYRDYNRDRDVGVPIELRPVPGDLCVAMLRWNMPFPPSVGRPLRIPRETVNEAIGPWPRYVAGSRLQESGAEIPDLQQ